MDIINPYRFASAAPTVVFDGFGNASRYFDGVSDYISIPDINESNTAFSAMCWVKTTAVDWTNTFFAHWDNTLSQRSWVILPSRTAETNGKKLMVYITDDGSGNSTRSKRYYGTTDVSDGTWHHCAFTWDNGTLKLYVDGIEETTTKVWDAPFTSILNSSGPLSIGAVNPTGGGTSPIDAHIADCRIYDAVLSSTDIAAIYGGEHIITNLVGHWLKDTPSLLDHSGTNDGTNEGSAFAYDNPSPAVEFGKASRYFNGSGDYITTANTVSIGTGSMSWSAWAKTPALLTGTSVDTIARVGDNGGAAGGNSTYDGLHLLFYQNKLTVYFADFANSGLPFIYQTSSNYNANQWYHLCGVLNATTQKLELYVDGVLDGSVDVSAAYPWNLTATRPPTIGARLIGLSYNNRFAGNIADVRLYDDALSSTDALALYNGAHVETNLIGHWLTNTDDVKDYAGVNDGTNIGSTYSFDNPLSEGEFGSASRYFVGGDYVDLSNSTDFDLTSTLTMSFWINPDNAHNGGIFGKWTTGAGTNNSYACYFGQDSSNLRVAFILQQSTAPRIRLDSNIDLPAGEWSHVCCVADGTNMRIYINGVLNVSTTYDGTIKTTTKKLIIGRLREEDGLYPFKGYIADVRLYDTGLLAQDIFDLSRGYDYRTNLIGQWLTNKDDVKDYAGTNDGLSVAAGFVPTYSQNAPL